MATCVGKLLHPGEGPRLLLYSHDSWGLGHLRRSLAIAHAVVEAFPTANVLLVTGSPCATQFPHSPRIDIVKLPAVTKDTRGSYVPRFLSGTLATITELRRQVLLAAFRSFDPHVVWVDHQILGLANEMSDVLDEAKRAGAHCILGLRDIIDTPARVAASWDNTACRQALNGGYDRILVYGDQNIFDACVAYEALRSTRTRVEFTGYVVPPNGHRSVRPVPAVRPQVLVTMGGGEDGRDRINTYLRAQDLAEGAWETSLVTGPLMELADIRDLKKMARRRPLVTVHRFHGDVPQLMRNADLIVSMAGYNASAEILQSGRPAILLPRTFPRQEQLIRARCLADLNLAYCLVEPNPSQLADAIQTALSTRLVSSPPALDGLDYIVSMLREHFDAGLQQPAAICAPAIAQFGFAAASV